MQVWLLLNQNELISTQTKLLKNQTQSNLLSALNSALNSPETENGELLIIQLSAFGDQSFPVLKELVARDRRFGKFALAALRTNASTHSSDQLVEVYLAAQRAISNNLSDLKSSIEWYFVVAEEAEQDLSKIRDIVEANSSLTDNLTDYVDIASKTSTSARSFTEDQQLELRFSDSHLRNKIYAFQDWFEKDRFDWITHLEKHEIDILSSVISSIQYSLAFCESADEEDPPDVEPFPQPSLGTSDIWDFDVASSGMVMEEYREKLIEHSKVVCPIHIAFVEQTPLGRSPVDEHEYWDRFTDL